MSGGNAKNGMMCVQTGRHDATTVGNLLPHGHISSRSLGCRARSCRVRTTPESCRQPGESALVFADQPRLTRALPIAWHLDPQRPIVGQHRFAARPISMMARVVGFGAAGWISQMVRQLATERPLDDRLLESADRRIERLGRDRSLPNEMTEDFLRYRGQRGVRRQIPSSAAHSVSSCYAHTGNNFGYPRAIRRAPLRPWAPYAPYAPLSTLCTLRTLAHRMHPTHPTHPLHLWM